MAENLPENDIMETRYEFMAPQLIRLGHFLKPSFSTSRRELSNLPRRAFTYNQNNSADIPLKVSFKGWQKYYKPWNNWVQRMEPLYGPTWRRVGIFDAIEISTLPIYRNENVIMGLAKKWFSETGTFVFKWGEASITLEDICVLGGYSPSGESVVTSPNENTQEIVEADKKLDVVRRRIWNSGARKVPFNLWIEFFQQNDEFRDVEHAAFLVFWLSKYVFGGRTNVVGNHVHTIAIRLSMGVKVALGPAVLASIYRDLRILRSVTTAAATIYFEETEKIEICSPMHLVQIWALERFAALVPPPNPVWPGEPIMYRWAGCRHQVSKPDMELAIESDPIGFTWQPYDWFFENHELTENMYKFVRPSELVGLDCIERYRPHRVARQFGFDQDLPGPVYRSNQNAAEAWETYNKPTGDLTYVPPRSVNTGVTTRYLAWWNRSKSYVEAGPSQERGN